MGFMTLFDKAGTNGMVNRIHLLIPAIYAGENFVQTVVIQRIDLRVQGIALTSVVHPRSVRYPMVA